MTAHSDRPRTWSRARRILAWLPSLIEPASSPAEPHHPPPQRLSRSGQVLLGSTLALVGVILYAQSLQWSLKSNQQFRFCQPLSMWGVPLNQEKRQTQRMINALAGATASQKVRLNQQVQMLQAETQRLCELVVLSRAQEEALLAVATAGLCLLILTIAHGVVQGLVNNTNRTMQVLQVSAIVWLLSSVAFLYVGQEFRNTSRTFQLYLWHRDLQQQVASALANQDRPAFRLQAAFKQETAQRNGAHSAPLLSDSAQVARLIRGIDEQLQSLPPLSVNLDESAVKKIFDWISTGMDHSS